MEQLRYYLDPKWPPLYMSPTSNLNDNPQIEIRKSHSRIYVNIHEYAKEDDRMKYGYMRVTLYYADGSTLTSWLWNVTDYIRIQGEEQLYDGRFNA
jgi:hypothetical protein